MLDAYIEKLAAARSTEETTAALLDAGETFGASAVFCLGLPYKARAGRPVRPIISTFPASIQDAYDAQGPGDDPFLEAALAFGAPIRFREHMGDFVWTEKQRRLFGLMAKAGFVDGVATPVIPRPGAGAYCSFAFSEPRDDLGPADLRRIFVVFCEFFSRYRQLKKRRVTFTVRERQVLVGVISGRSDTEIGERLGISPHTVGTYMRRCFEKLEVNSRMEAALKCFGLGIRENVDKDEVA